MHLRFVASESAFDYFRATRSYLEMHGKPIAFYSDKHSIFRVNAKDAAGSDGATQFGRALSELNIDIFCANSPQAKGRVERAFGTLQDRLVKSLPSRKRGSCVWPAFPRSRRPMPCLKGGVHRWEAEATVRVRRHRHAAQAATIR